MAVNDNRVEELCGMLEWGDSARRHIDWPVIEQSLVNSDRLPSDFRELVEILPPGVFRHWLKPIFPSTCGQLGSDYLERHHVTHLEVMRGMRDAGHRSYPYPFYPEFGGLLPWGRGRDQSLYCWVTDSADPDLWGVVWSDQTRSEWREYDGALGDFLIAFIRGEVRPLDDPGMDLLSEPAFHVSRLTDFRSGGVTYPFEPPAVPVIEPSAKMAPWPVFYTGGPEDEYDILAKLLSSAKRPRKRTDWGALESCSGRGLPSDYKNFLDRFGVGDFYGIRLLSPDHQPPSDMKTAACALQDRVSRGVPSFMAQSFRDIVIWGEVADGKMFGWRTAAQDVEEWSVVIIDRSMSITDYQNVSFSSFLLDWSGRNPNFEVETFLL
jgi:hypothetical protein